MDSRRVGQILAGVGILEMLLALCFFVLTRTGLLVWGSPFSMLSVAFALFAGIALMHSRLSKLAAEEERTETDRSVGSDLFSDDDIIAGAGARGLRQFERWVLPSGVVVLSVLQLVAGLLCLRFAAALVGPSTPLDIVPLPVGIACFVGAFILFLVARYAAEVQGETTTPFLRPAASRAMLLSGLLFLGGTGAIVAYLGRNAELRLNHITQLWQLRLLGTVAVVLGIEGFVNVLVSFYRFRASRTAVSGCSIHDSRLCRLLLDPSGLLSGLADVLEYQFGVSVSEEWLSRFFLRNVLPLISLGIGVLLVASCIAIVSPAEVAVIERWGLPRGNEVGPGFHVKFPWPIETVRRFQPGLIRSFSVGMEDTVATKQDGGPGTWDSVSPKAPRFFTAGSGARRVLDETGLSRGPARRTPITNLVVAEMVVSYNVENISQYYYRHSEPEELLRSVSRRVLTEQLAGTDGLTAMGSDRNVFAAVLTNALQKEANALDLGAHILSAGLSRIQPPAPVVSAFRGVAEEEQNRRQRLLSASAYAIQTVPVAEATAQEIVAAAQQQSVSASATAEAFAETFMGRIIDRDAIPGLYRWLLYLERLERTIGDAPKIVVATECSDQVLSVDLKSDTAPGLLDIGMPAGSGE